MLYVLSVRRVHAVLASLLAICLVVGLSSGAAHASTTVWAVQTPASRMGNPVNTVGSTRSPGGYTPVTTQRLLDTRTGGAALRPAGSVTPVSVLGRAGLPTTPVAAVVANVTAAGPTADGWVIAYPSQTSRPNASTLNFIAGRTTPNRAVLPVGADGKVLLYTSATTHLLFDVVGYFPANGYFARTAPTRLADTRIAGGMLAEGETRRVKVTGRAGIPLSGVAAVAVNIAAVSPTQSGALSTTRSFSTTTPPEQNLYSAGRNHASLIIAEVLPEGDIVVRSTGRTHVIVDVTGWLLRGGDFIPRDTARSNPSMWIPEASPRQPAGTTRVFRPVGWGEKTALLPAVGVNSVEVTVIVMYPRSHGYVTVFPTGQPRPTVSTSNYDMRDNNLFGVTSNTATVTLGADGTFSVYTSAEVEVYLVTGGYHTAVVGRVTSTIGPAFAPQFYPGNISCAAENSCLASNGDGSVYSWNGTNWTRSAPLFPAGATEISCGTPSTCALAASNGEVWTSAGGTWRKQVPLGSPIGNPHVDCVSASFCLLAAGGHAATFNGSTWTRLAVPDSVARSGVSSMACSSASLCVVYSGTVGQLLRNGVWESMSGFGYPATCSHAGFCTFPQGNYQPRESTYWTVATPSRWFFSYVPPAPDPLSYVSGAGCTPSGRCVVFAGQSAALTNLATWGQPVDIGTSLVTVSCPTDRFCMGVDRDNRTVTLRL